MNDLTAPANSFLLRTLFLRSLLLRGLFLVLFIRCLS